MSGWLLKGHYPESEGVIPHYRCACGRVGEAVEVSFDSRELKSACCGKRVTGADKQYGAEAGGLTSEKTSRTTEAHDPVAAGGRKDAGSSPAKVPHNNERAA